MSARDGLAAEVDRHWLRDAYPVGEGVAVGCTCDGWLFKFGPGDHVPEMGEQFLPFSEHVADAILAARTDGAGALAAALGLDSADVESWPLEVVQRYADGEALHRLREALPDKHFVVISSPIAGITDWGTEWDVEVRPAGEGMRYEAHALTLAAAADAAREAVARG